MRAFLDICPWCNNHQASTDGHRQGCPNPLARVLPSDEPTQELDTRELPAYDDDNEDTLPDAGAETSHR
jgi:hypothetical protein